MSKVIDGVEAERIGIANRVCEDGEYLETARAMCRELAAQPAAAVRLSKALMKRPYLEQLREHMKFEGDRFGERLDSPEAREAMTAFMEKRQPDFSQFD